MRHAFTLIELMIVVAIIAVIAAIAIPQLMEKRKEQDAAAATPPVPAWKGVAVTATNQMATYVVTAPDGQQWVVFNGQGTTALPYTPRAVPAGTTLQVEKQ